jgi:hypothetical protein
MNNYWDNILVGDGTLQSPQKVQVISFRNETFFLGGTVSSPVLPKRNDALINDSEWDEMHATAYYKCLIKQQQDYNVSENVINKIIGISHRLDRELASQQLTRIKEVLLDPDDFSYFEMTIVEHDKVAHLDVYLDDDEVYGVCKNSILVGTINDMKSIVNQLFQIR